MTTANSDETLVLRDFLAILAREVRLLADGASRGDGALSWLQGLDHLVQTANELSHFLDDVALESDGHISVSVAGPARRVKLRALAEALVRVSREVPPSTDSPALGHVDLF
jgi:IS5 family transposase